SWQGNTQKSLAPPHAAHALHQMMWVLAVEAQAKLVTFVALAEHRERGDSTPWDSSIGGSSTDRAQMEALHKVLDANKGKTVTDNLRDIQAQLCSVFNAFCTGPLRRRLYEAYIAGFVARSNSARPISDADFSRERGALPGVSANFLKTCNVSINDP